MDISVVIQIGVSLLTLGSIYGILTTKIAMITDNLNRLEIKQDKHNNLIERMAVVEESAKAAHNRIDDHTRDGCFNRGDKTQNTGGK